MVQVPARIRVAVLPETCLLYTSQKPVRVLVVGAGGTGSAIVMGLPYLDQAIRVWGRSSGIEVVMMDADTVSETNCVRQPFSISDIGQNKATVLINRINLFWGTRWRAESSNFDERTFDRIQDCLLYTSRCV